MATFAVTANPVLKQNSGAFYEVVEDFVERAAKAAPHNRLSTTPPNFGTRQEGNKVVGFHAASGVTFKPGFQMTKDPGACKWEGQVTGEGLRLDLQGIDNGFANWQVQTNKPAGQSKTIAACLMEVDGCFGQRHLLHALKLSHKEAAIVKLSR